MKKEANNCGDEIIHEGITYVAATTENESLVRSALEGKEKGSGGVYITKFNFLFNGMRRFVSITYDAPVEAPRREEVVVLRFNDFGKVKRISASVEYAIHDFYPVGTINGVTNPAYFVEIKLKGVTEQPL